MTMVRSEHFTGNAGRSGDARKKPATRGASNGERPSRRERERLHHRTEILAAAEELFAHFGFEKTGVKQIAERAELSVGQIYNHFEGKEQVFREIMERHLRELHERGDEACDADDPPLRQLRSRIEAAIAHFKEHRDFLIIYHRENRFTLEGLIEDEIRTNREIIAGLFDAAMQRGEIPREDPHVLAAMLIGAVHRLLDMFMDGDDREAFDAVPGIIERVIIEPLETRKRRVSQMEEDQ